jgi:arylsulfatase
MHRSFDIDLEVDHPDGAAGVLVAHGDQGGGYALYVLDGELVFAYNEYGHLRRASAGPLAGGPHQITLSATALPQFRWSWAVTVDGVEVTRLEDVAQLMASAPFTGITVGRDGGGPVDWDVYEKHRTFPYTGTLRPVTYRPGAWGPDTPAARMAAARAAAAIDD